MGEKEVAVSPTELEELALTCDDIIIPPLELNTENLVDIKFDEKEFQKGLTDISFIAGQITGLINVGISPIEALGFIVNRETIKHNLDSAVISKEMNIEVAKHQSIMIEKNQL